MSGGKGKEVSKKEGVWDQHTRRFKCKNSQKRGEGPWKGKKKANGARPQWKGILGGGRRKVRQVLFDCSQSREGSGRFSQKRTGGGEPA